MTNVYFKERGKLFGLNWSIPLVMDWCCKKKKKMNNVGNTKVGVKINHCI